MDGRQVFDSLAGDARRFHALADPNRLAILCALQQGEKCACELLEDLQISQPTLSHHMKLLVGSGLVAVRKEGRWMHYSIVPEAAQSFRVMMEQYARCACEEDASISCFS
ncbi:metalloregulator ArsR/SmtB family transcription factor [uncultured Selenomonas sp.]|uniref:ArsR/SmtB family transcription factor n=1 Tax=uncultured Selenomonas sp. TaxID=159275 RepID=UPI0025E19285|nr:metalloregulator ArsR/SmtB family transcription factor [uncultured Selenomonas sp.]